VLGKIAYRQNPEGVVAVFEQPRWDVAGLARSGAAEGPPSPGVGADGASGENDPALRWRTRSGPALSGGNKPALATGVAPGSAAGELWLVAVGTAKPGNLGAMARTADAAGAAGLLVADAVVDPFNPNAIRASTGAVFTLPIVAADSDRLVRWLRDRPTPLRPIAADPSAPTAHSDTDLTGPLAIIIGAEDTGLPGAWLDLARRHGAVVSIPMSGRSADSLNASVAAGVLLFEAVRQRSRQSDRD
jgi:RNA methyltransferase, TrmH family